MRASLVLVLAALATLTGCNLLAKANPCGGGYPADGVAEVGPATIDGQMDLGAPAAPYTFTSNPTADVGQDCSVFFSGLAPDDGSGTADLEVTCATTTVVLTLPDVRALAQGAEVSLPATVKGNDGACFEGEATLTIEQAVGAKAPAPSFVTPGFVRAGAIDFAGSGGDAGSGGGGGASEWSACPAHVALHGHIELTAGDYQQAMQWGEDHCPDLPSK